MKNKSLLVSLIFVVLITFFGCSDEDTSSKKEEEFDKIPNVMKNAVTELEQIVTLLGGPIFDGRNEIEELKKQQIQTLLNEISEGREQSLTESGSQEQSKNGEIGGNQEQKLEDGGMGGGSRGNKDETGNTEDTKEGEGSEEKSNENDSEKENGNSGGKAQKDNSSSDSNDMESARGQQKIADFQFEDSLFGIPQWQNDNWKVLQVLSDGMHFTWNSIQPDLLQRGVSSSQIENFSDILAGLSKAVKNKNIKDAQIASYHMTKLNAEFHSYYKTHIPPEIHRLKSSVTGIHFYVRQNDWNNTQVLAAQLQQEITKLKNNTEIDKSDTLQMLEISVSDLEKAVLNQDPALVLIRTNLVIVNIKEMEDKLTQSR